jgi:hypothetical protein
MSKCRVNVVTKKGHTSYFKCRVNVVALKDAENLPILLKSKMVDEIYHPAKCRANIVKVLDGLTTFDFAPPLKGAISHPKRVF